jgi:hypothetical protein
MWLQAFSAGRPLARLLLLLVAVAASSAAWAQPAGVARVACGEYEAVPGGTADGRPTRLGIQRAGRLLLSVTDYAVLRVECADSDADGTPELIVSTFSGGAHCCETIHVWALGRKPEKLLEYEAGNAGGFERRDLDGDGREELVLGDDTFSYFGDLCYACSPSRLPLVACRTARGFEECTRRFPDVVKSAIATAAGRVKPPADAADVPFVEGAALGWLAASTLIGDAEPAMGRIRAAVGSDEVMKWLERARPQVRDWAAARSKRVKDGR